MCYDWSGGSVTCLVEISHPLAYYIFFLLTGGDLTICCDWSGRVIACVERAPGPPPRTHTFFTTVFF
jgi:hypothetical protein